MVSKDLADQATHDFLIKLFAETKSNLLLEHLKKFGKNKRRVPYNVGRALSVCIEKSKLYLIFSNLKFRVDRLLRFFVLLGGEQF